MLNSVGGVGQILAWVTWVAWVYKMLAWVKKMAWVAWVGVLSWVAWVHKILAWVKKKRSVGCDFGVGGVGLRCFINSTHATHKPTLLTLPTLFSRLNCT